MIEVIIDTKKIVIIIVAFSLINNTQSFSRYIWVNNSDSKMLQSP